MRALSKDPASRPQTALAFRAELLAISALRRAPLSPPRAEGRRFRQSRLAKVITLALLTGSLAVLSYALYQSRERLQAVIAPEESKFPTNSTGK